MADDEPDARQHPAKLFGLRLDRLHPVVDVEDLAAAVQLAQDGVTDEPRRRLGHPGLDRQPVLRRGLDDRHVADAREGQVERPRDGRRRQGQDIHLALELLETLLGGHAESLLLVHDDQPEVLEPDVLAQQTVRPDDQVHGPVHKPGDSRGLGTGRHESREQAHLQREGGEALREGRVVLGGEHGRRYKDRHLLAILHRLEGRPQRDLGLAVADVTDDQPVHRSCQLHVRLDLQGRSKLVDRLLVREGRLHLGLPWRVGRKGVAACPCPRGIQGEQLLGKIVDGLAHALLGAQPLRAAELRERRPFSARVATDSSDLLDRHEDPIAAGERQLQVIAVLTGAATSEHLLVASDAMVDVDDEIARGQALQDVTRHDPPEGLRPADTDRAEQLAVRDEGETIRAADETAVEAAFDERHGAGRGRFLHPRHDRHGMAALAEDVRETRRLVGGEHDPRAVSTPGRDGFDQSSGTAGGQDRLPPPERITRGEAAARHRDILRRDRFPGQLQRPGTQEATLPVPWREVRGRPVLGQLAGGDQLRAPLVCLAPQESRGLGDVARLIEDEERARLEVIEAGRTGQVGGPDLGRVPDRERP